MQARLTAARLAASSPVTSTTLPTTSPVKCHILYECQYGTQPMTCLDISVVCRTDDIISWWLGCFVFFLSYLISNELLIAVLYAILQYMVHASPVSIYDYLAWISSTVHTQIPSPSVCDNYSFCTRFLPPNLMGTGCAAFFVGQFWKRQDNILHLC